MILPFNFSSLSCSLPPLPFPFPRSGGNRHSIAVYGLLYSRRAVAAMMRAALSLCLAIGSVSNASATAAAVGQDADGNLVLRSVDGGDIFLNDFPVSSLMTSTSGATGGGAAASIASLTASVTSLMARLDGAIARIDEQDVIIADQGFTTPSPTSTPTTPAPTSNSAAPTAPPHSAPTAAPTLEDIAAGNIIVSATHYPAALCTGGTTSDPTGCEILSAEREAAIAQVTGTVRVAYYNETTLAGRFPALELVLGDFVMERNAALTELGTGAFGALARVAGDFLVWDNNQLRAIDGTHFSALATVSGYFKVRGNDRLLAIDGTAFSALATVSGYFVADQNYQLQAINGTAFSALATVSGYFRMQENNVLRAIDGTAFSALAAVSGYFKVNTNRQLTGLASFTSLTSVHGQLAVHDNAATFDRDGALPALACIGSYFWEDAANQIPLRALSLPTCG